MDYFFYNTDADALSEQPRPRFHVLIDRGFAAVGGDRQQFGEQLGPLAPDDVLLMYENGVGVVAVGRVRERWDGVSHATPQYYKPGRDEWPHGRTLRVPHRGRVVPRSLKFAD